MMSPRFHDVQKYIQRPKYIPSTFKVHQKALFRYLSKSEIDNKQTQFLQVRMCLEMSSSDKNSNGSDLSQIRNSAELRSNLQNISAILNTGLTPETLDICIQLCEAGVHPQALANVIQQIRREVAQIQHDSTQAE